MKAWRIAAALCGLLAASGAAVAEDAPAEVVVHATGAGAYYRDAAGKSLYTYGKDSPGASACLEACSAAWPPLAAPAGAPPVGGWSALRRDDGTFQWALDGRPLYRHAADTHAGAAFGDGADDVWRLAFKPIAMPPELAIFGADIGRLLADTRGMTVYAPAQDAAPCGQDCLARWQPVAAPAIAAAWGPWSVRDPGDGTRQWAYQGRPLFTYRGERAAGALQGARHAGWEAILLEPLAARPAWVTVHPSDLGPVLADPRGMTLYYTPTRGRWSLEFMLEKTCNLACVAANFRPVLWRAGEPETIDNWSALALEDGTRVWGFKGLPVYTFVKDKAPGDAVYGEHFASGGTTQTSGFRAIGESLLMRSAGLLAAQE